MNTSNPEVSKIAAEKKFAKIKSWNENKSENKFQACCKWSKYTWCSIPRRKKILAKFFISAICSSFCYFPQFHFRLIFCCCCQLSFSRYLTILNCFYQVIVGMLFFLLLFELFGWNDFGSVHFIFRKFLRKKNAKL